MLILAAFFIPICLAEEIYVPDDYGTIQEAIDSSGSSDTVIVRPGTYVENIDFQQKRTTVKSELGPDVTVIDGNGAGVVVAFPSGSNDHAVLQGFTITNGHANNGGGICCLGSRPTIQENVITGNSANRGGGIYCRNSTDTPSIINNIIVGNTADQGGAICSQNTDPSITNNTIYGNTAITEGGGLCCLDSSPLVTNTIFWNNDAPSGGEIHADAGSSPSVTHCDVQGGWPGTGNIDVDPLFADLLSRDPHLTWNSPCRDAGNNDAPGITSEDFEGDPRIHDTGVDMGADEYYLHLYFTGDLLAGGAVDAIVIGIPGTTPVTLGLGSGIQDPPQPTPYGDLHLQIPIIRIPMPDIGSDGLSVMSGTIPGSWLPGEEYPFQALAGSELTNLTLLAVEQ